MAGTISNVLIDEGTLYIELPAADGSGYVEQGYTEEGSNFTYTPTNADITVHEETVPIGSVIETEELVIDAMLAESTLAVLQTALAGASVAGDVLTLGGGVMQFARVKIVTDDPDNSGKYRKVELFKCALGAPVTLPSRRTSETTVPVSFKAIKDATYGVGIIERNLATKTS